MSSGSYDIDLLGLAVALCMAAGAALFSGLLKLGVVSTKVLLGLPIGRR